MFRFGIPTSYQGRLYLQLLHPGTSDVPPTLQDVETNVNEDEEDMGGYVHESISDLLQVLARFLNVR